jgi:putative phage-type endonuclease
MTKVRTPEWLERRREGVTGTDIPAILGLSPYSSEGDIARSKLGEEQEHDAESERRMRIGTALESVVLAEDEREHGYTVRPVDELQVHPNGWAMASLDGERLDGTIVEVKTSGSRRWNDGLPPEVEAQVQWQLGVTGRARAHVACLRFGSTLECYDLEAKPDDFRGMLRVAQDFRSRLASGGPFMESRSSINRAFVADDTELVADEGLDLLVRTYLAARDAANESERAKDEASVAIKSRMGPATKATGVDWTATWRPNRPSIVTDWNLVAKAYRQLLVELTDGFESDVIRGVESIHTREVAGSRPLLIRREKETRQDG